MKAKVGEARSDFKLEVCKRAVWIYLHERHNKANEGINESMFPPWP